MVARRALTAAGCSHCRLSALKLLTGPAIATTRTAVTSAGPIPLRRLNLTPITTRHFSSPPDQNIKSTTSEQIYNESLKDDASPEDDLTPSRDAEAEEDVPWYLQVDPPRHVATLEPTPLPEVPADSPQLLGPLLEYASEEMGLHDLALLDLRAMDPPPALGSNLFMLFGTARSERHLAVSAGRLVRWLRVKHRVYADADGLLGPNERKTKLRRKAKRAKLLGTMGTDDADDGLSTGWICVNLGSIDRDSTESSVVSEDGRVEGFGVAQDGFTVVFQIMTESRRADLDLERLWEDALEASIKKASRESEAKKPHPIEQALSAATTPSRPTLNQKGNNKTSKGQVSFYSTIREVPINDSTDPLLVNSLDTLNQTLLSDARQKYRVLDLLTARLAQSTPDQARQYFGDFDGEQSSTPFLEVFELAIRHLPAPRTWGYRLAVLTKLAQSRHTAATASLIDVKGMLNEMRVDGIPASRAQYLQLLSCIHSTSVKTDDQTVLALELLQTMEQRGQSVVANDIITTIIEATADSMPRDEFQRLVERLMKLRVTAELPCMAEDLIMRLLTIFVRSNMWEEVWNVWRMPSQFMVPRSPALYAHIIRLGASSTPGFAAHIIRRTNESMLHENPPVLPVGEVHRALNQCVYTADPRAHSILVDLPDNPDGQNAKLAAREFVNVLRSLEVFQ